MAAARRSLKQNDNSRGLSAEEAEKWAEVVKFSGR